MTYDPSRNVLTVCACPYCKEVITEDKGCECCFFCVKGVWTSRTTGRKEECAACEGSGLRHSARVRA